MFRTFLVFLIIFFSPLATVVCRAEDSAQALYLKASKLVREGNLKAGELILKRIVADFPNDPIALRSDDLLNDLVRLREEKGISETATSWLSMTNLGPWYGNDGIVWWGLPGLLKNISDVRFSGSHIALGGPTVFMNSNEIFPTSFEGLKTGYYMCDYSNSDSLGRRRSLYEMGLLIRGAVRREDPLVLQLNRPFNDSYFHQSVGEWDPSRTMEEYRANKQNIAPLIDDFSLEISLLPSPERFERIPLETLVNNALQQVRAEWLKILEIDLRLPPFNYSEVETTTILKNSLPILDRGFTGVFSGDIKERFSKFLFADYEGSNDYLMVDDVIFHKWLSKESFHTEANWIRKTDVSGMIFLDVEGQYGNSYSYVADETEINEYRRTTYDSFMNEGSQGSDRPEMLVRNGENYSITVVAIDGWITRLWLEARKDRSILHVFDWREPLALWVDHIYIYKFELSVPEGKQTTFSNIGEAALGKVPLSSGKLIWSNVYDVNLLILDPNQCRGKENTLANHKQWKENPTPTRFTRLILDYIRKQLNTDFEGHVPLYVERRAGGWEKVN